MCGDNVVSIRSPINTIDCSAIIPSTTRITVTWATRSHIINQTTSSRINDSDFCAICLIVRMTECNLRRIRRPCSIKARCRGSVREQLSAVQSMIYSLPRITSTPAFTNCNHCSIRRPFDGVHVTKIWSYSSENTPITHMINVETLVSAYYQKIAIWTEIKGIIEGSRSRAEACDFNACC